MLIAAFLWRKNPRDISTLIFDDQTMEIISPPKIYILPKSAVTFRKKTQKAIQNFFGEIIYFQHFYHQPVKIEYKIIFNTIGIPHLIPTPESRYVLNNFFYWLKKTKTILKNLTLSPQIRRKLTGRHLKKFNRTLRSLGLVSSKANTRYEYNLWAIALHATVVTYEKKLHLMKEIIFSVLWNQKV